jgi:hypothetical protein
MQTAPQYFGESSVWYDNRILQSESWEWCVEQGWIIFCECIRPCAGKGSSTCTYYHLFELMSDELPVLVFITLHYPPVDTIQLEEFKCSNPTVCSRCRQQFPRSSGEGNIYYLFPRSFRPASKLSTSTAYSSHSSALIFLSYHSMAWRLHLPLGVKFPCNARKSFRCSDCRTPGIWLSLHCPKIIWERRLRLSSALKNTVKPNPLAKPTCRWHEAHHLTSWDWYSSK